MCPAHDAMLNGKWKSHANGIHMGSHFTYERKFTRDLDSHEQLIHMSFNLGELDQNQGCFLYAKCRLGVKCEWNSHGKPLRVWVDVHTRLGFTRAVDSQELQIWASWDLVFLISLPCQRSDTLRTKSSGKMPPSRRVQGLYRLRDVTAADCDVSSSQGFPKPRQPKPNKLNFRINPCSDNHQNRLDIYRKNSEINVLTQNNVSVFFDTQIWQTNGWFLPWRKRESSAIFGTE